MTFKIIINGAILAKKGWIEPGHLIINGGEIKKIEAGRPAQELLAQAKEIIDARYCAVLPGLTNAHTHLSQTFMRGLAGGRPLINWLEAIIWPLQGVISPNEMVLAAQLGLVENLRCGAIWVTDHHKITATPNHTEAVLKAAREIGLNITLARSWSDKGKNQEKPESILADLQHLFDQAQDDPRINIANGPLALWRCSADTIRATHNLALEQNAFTHFHVSESLFEVKMALEEYGKRPVEWLNSIDILDSSTQIVHAVWVDEAEIKLIAASEAPVIHCPVSNAVLGSGVAPISQMLARGVEIRLGTDGPASNDTQDIWETLKSAVIFARAISLDSTILPPAQALSLATLGKTLNEGDSADLVIVNLNHERVVPVQDIDSALVLGTHGSDVETVIVGGDVLMRDGKVIALDEAALYDECRDAIKFLRKRTGLAA